MGNETRSLVDPYKFSSIPRYKEGGLKRNFHRHRDTARSGGRHSSPRVDSSPCNGACALPSKFSIGYHLLRETFYVTNGSLSAATIAMNDIDKWFNSTLGKLSDQNYEQSLALYRLWFDIGHTHSQIRSDRIFDDIWKHRGSDAVSPKDDKLFHPAAHLILRFVNDAESDRILGPYSTGLRRRFDERIVQEFFKNNVLGVYGGDGKLRRSEVETTNYVFAVDSNLLAWWANSGYVEEATIRNHILQSLTSHLKLYDHQADALIILFKLAGATLEAYADPSVVDRCIELLRNHYRSDTVKHNLVRVRTPCTEKCTIELMTTSRKYSNYGSAVGRVFLPHLCSQAISQGQMAQARKISAQPPSPHLWDYQTWTSSRRSLGLLRSILSPPQRLKRSPLSPSRHQLAWPVCPTSQSQIPPMTNLSPIPRP